MTLNWQAKKMSNWWGAVAHRAQRLAIAVGGAPWAIAFCIVGGSVEYVAAQTPTDMDLKVGIVQRFGSQATDSLTLQATTGDKLTLQWVGDNKKPQTVQVDSVKLEVLMQRLPAQKLDEQLVLGNYRSFETAEDSAEKWRASGLEVEVAQAERWQVWAKRDVYKTPLIRRLLLKGLQRQGNKTAYLETKIRQETPVISWVVNGYRYNGRQLSITAGNKLIGVSQGKQKDNNRIYGGSLRLQPNAYGSYTLVNQVPLETYLRGVVPHEISAGAPYAAMEAQTIIARTYALRNLRRFAIDGYHLCADTQCQVYKGLTGSNRVADRAIVATRGQVLTYQNQLVDALYSSTTGGVTAPFGDVWNGPERPYLKALVDARANVWDLSRQSLAEEQNFRQFINLKRGFNENGWGTFRWRKESSLKQITQDLQTYLKNTKSPQADFQTIQQMQVVERSPAGRILQVAVQTDKGVVPIYKDDVRSAFIAPRSTFFYLEPVYERNKTLKGYAFVGGGFGHGVGLSQTGAYNLAKQGWTAGQILNFYYPETKIQPIKDSVVFWQDKPAPAAAGR